MEGNRTVEVLFTLLSSAAWTSTLVDEEADVLEEEMDMLAEDADMSETDLLGVCDRLDASVCTAISQLVFVAGFSVTVGKLVEPVVTVVALVLFFGVCHPNGSNAEFDLTETTGVDEFFLHGFNIPLASACLAFSENRF
jgi:hypothetical protein